MVRRYSQTGITLVEVLIALSIIAGTLVAIGLLVTLYVNSRAALLADTKAMYLAEDGYEILRALRDDDWTTIDELALDTTHYLAVTPSTLTVTNTPEVIDTDFTRSFVVKAVYRNSTSDDIVAGGSPGAVIDNDSREIEVSVVGPNGTRMFEAILTNYKAQ